MEVSSSHSSKSSPKMSKLNKLFISKINNINKCISKLESSNKKLLKLRSESLKKKVHNICETVDNDRLAQEVALLALKHDVAEEIERIKKKLKVGLTQVLQDESELSVK